MVEIKLPEMNGKTVINYLKLLEFVEFNFAVFLVSDHKLPVKLPKIYLKDITVKPPINFKIEKRNRIGLGKK